MLLAQNKRANFDYQVQKTFQAGMVLDGKLVKQLRARRVNIQGKFIIFQKDQLQIIGLGNSEYEQNVILLVSQKEKREIVENLKIKGKTCILLDIHTSKRWIKANIALAVGEKKYDKKESIKNREIDREIRRSMSFR